MRNGPISLRLHTQVAENNGKGLRRLGVFQEVPDLLYLFWHTLHSSASPRWSTHVLVHAPYSALYFSR